MGSSRETKHSRRAATYTVSADGRESVAFSSETMDVPSVAEYRRRQLIRRNRILGSVLVLLLLATIAAAGYLFWQKETLHRQQYDELRRVAGVNNASLNEFRGDFNLTTHNDVRRALADLDAAIKDAQAKLDDELVNVNHWANDLLTTEVGRLRDTIDHEIEIELNGVRDSTMAYLTNSTASIEQSVNRSLSALEAKLIERVNRRIEETGQSE